MIKVDDRIKEQKETHTRLVAATDRFLSGWGNAEGGVSYCAWACKPEHMQAVWRWVSARTDMMRVRLMYRTWHPRGTGHARIYVVGDDHPALEGCAV